MTVLLCREPARGQQQEIPQTGGQVEPGNDPGRPDAVQGRSGTDGPQGQAWLSHCSDLLGVELLADVGLDSASLRASFLLAILDDLTGRMDASVPITAAGAVSVAISCITSGQPPPLAVQQLAWAAAWQCRSWPDEAACRCAAAAARAVSDADDAPLAVAAACQWATEVTGDKRAAFRRYAETLSGLMSAISQV